MSLWRVSKRIMTSNYNLSSNFENDPKEDRLCAFGGTSNSTVESSASVSKEICSEMLFIRDINNPPSSDKDKAENMEDSLPSTSTRVVCRYPPRQPVAGGVKKVSDKNPNNVPYAGPLPLTLSNQALIPKTPEDYYLQILYNITKDCDSLSFEEYVDYLVKVLKGLYDPHYDYKSDVLTKREVWLSWRGGDCKVCPTFDDMLRTKTPLYRSHLYSELSFSSKAIELQTNNNYKVLQDGTVIIGWDIENRPAKNKNLADVIEKLRNTYGREAKIYVAIAKSHDMFELVSAALQHMEGVQLLPASSGRNAADNELKEVMDEFVKDCILPACAVFITDDLGCLIDTINNLKKKGVKIILYPHKRPAEPQAEEMVNNKKKKIQKENKKSVFPKNKNRQDMMKFADEVLPFKEFIRDIPNLLQSAEHSVIFHVPEGMNRKNLQAELEKLCEVPMKLSYLSRAVKVTVKSAIALDAFYNAVNGKRLSNNTSLPLYVINL